MLDKIKLFEPGDTYDGYTFQESDGIVAMHEDHSGLMVHDYTRERALKRLSVVLAECFEWEIEDHNKTKAEKLDINTTKYLKNVANYDLRKFKDGEATGARKMARYVLYQFGVDWRE